MGRCCCRRLKAALVVAFWWARGAQVLEGMFGLAKRLFDVEVVAADGVPVWHPDARFFKVLKVSAREPDVARRRAAPRDADGRVASQRFWPAAAGGAAGRCSQVATTPRPATTRSSSGAQASGR